MKFSQPTADIFVPDKSAAEEALRSVTHLCVGAHQDDIEIMAHAGIAACVDSVFEEFGAVVATDGSGSPRSGKYADFTDEQMRATRVAEQRTAATLGKYAIQLQLAHPSSAVKKRGASALIDDLRAIFSQSRAHTIYIHNPADKHDTHVALFLRCLEALRSLPAEHHPKKLLGCEVWRDLDWLVDNEKVALDASAHPELAAKMLRAFDSQISGGKRYDLATLGRRLANATFHTSHAVDRATALTWAIDLTPLLKNPALDPIAFTTAAIERFRDDAAQRLKRFS